MNRRAFTLLEVLVSLLLVGVLAAGIGLALRTGLDASDRIRERTEVHSEARAALDLLAADLSAAYLSEANPGETLFTGQPPEASDQGAPFLRFTTLSYRHSGGAVAQQEARSDAVRVEYSLRSRSDGTANLMRQERWLTESGPGETAVVCERVGALQLKYLGKNGDEPSWTADPDADPPLKVEDPSQLSDASSAERSLPRAVEVTLLLAPRTDRERDKPRAYKTLIQLGATGTAPFETEVVPPAQPGPQPEDGTGGTDGTGAPGG